MVQGLLLFLGLRTEVLERNFRLFAVLSSLSTSRLFESVTHDNGLSDSAGHDNETITESLSDEIMDDPLVQFNTSAPVLMDSPLCSIAQGGFLR